MGFGTKDQLDKDVLSEALRNKLPNPKNNPNIICQKQ